MTNEEIEKDREYFLNTILKTPKIAEQQSLMFIALMLAELVKRMPEPMQRPINPGRPAPLPPSSKGTSRASV